MVTTKLLCAHLHIPTNLYKIILICISNERREGIVICINAFRELTAGASQPIFADELAFELQM